MVPIPSALARKIILITGKPVTILVQDHTRTSIATRELSFSSSLLMPTMRPCSKQRTTACRLELPSKQSIELPGAIWGAPGRRVGDRVWRAKVRAEICKDEKLEAVETGGDLESCYDYVRWDKLARKAQRANYPMSILRLSLQTYAAKRIIRAAGGITSNPIQPRRGLGPGGGRKGVRLQPPKNWQPRSSGRQG